MSLPLRITFECEDYTYTILTKMIDKQTADIKIILNHQELTIVRNQQRERDTLERSISDHGGLIKAIARNVALRYQL